MRLHRVIFCLFYVISHVFSIRLSQFLRLASSDNYHNDPSIAALPSVENRIYEKMYVKPTTEKYDRFIRNGLFDFSPVIRHPYEYRIQ
ncbi:unnamed protein product [Caenorhabditis sp. 36 PRJEB53466]|nr:unnamed protein product [Caenorhabditis sp. 36 PRJEB53466]